MVLVFAELGNGRLKKTSIETAAYAAALATAGSTDCFAVALGNANEGELEKLGNYGVKKVFHVDDAKLNSVFSKAYAKVITEVAKNHAANYIVFSHNSTGKTVAPAVAVRVQAALMPGVTSLPDANQNYTKTVFSGKATSFLSAKTENVVITLNPNSYKPQTTSNTPTIEKTTVSLDTKDFDYEIVGVEDESEGMVPLPEAEIVVSAGRGLKGPENWGMIEEMAKILGATTACSRPVADIGWRPHHEHVGQTGLTIKPNLYIAIGISGAIQHLAGVNQSKRIVVINKDPEAPFFKAADYGIVGDAFEVVPKLNEAFRQFKNSHA
ncbi:MAG: electron transfer flavoprotein subunit alpha/FixB family protein [Chitinophagales bacterium]|nr:electron transfer flavoprotein subunit alpha/FixB family protein [Chitinophagales bacterium]